MHYVSEAVRSMLHHEHHSRISYLRLQSSTSACAACIFLVMVSACFDLVDSTAFCSLSSFLKWVARPSACLTSAVAVVCIPHENHSEHGSCAGYDVVFQLHANQTHINGVPALG